MGGETKVTDVGNPDDYKFMDPTGNYQGAMDFFSNEYNNNAKQMGEYAIQGASYDPNAYMQQFLGQSADLSNMVSGAQAPLQQSLNAIATRQAALGSEAALGAMPGAANSGAGMAAFGQAYADPFAQAQAQLQQNQLQGTLGLWNNALGLNQQGQMARSQFGMDAANLYGQQAANAANQYGGLAAGQGAWYQPTYQTPANTGPNWAAGGTGAVSGAAAGSAFGPWGTGIGAGIGGLAGLFGGQ